MGRGASEQMIRAWRRLLLGPAQKQDDTETFRDSSSVVRFPTQPRDCPEIRILNSRFPPADHGLPGSGYEYGVAWPIAAQPETGTTRAFIMVPTPATFVTANDATSPLVTS